MDLSQQAIDQILGNAAVGHEFGDKIKELDRRLSMNGMSYSGYDSLTDRQQEIFSQGLFLEPESAMDLREYVMSAVDSCWCPDVVEELHHHSPMLMREIEAEQEKLPDMTIRIGEGISGLNQVIDLLLEQLLEESQNEPVLKPVENVPPEQKALKALLKKVFEDAGIKTSDYQRTGHHLRTEDSPIPNNIELANLKPWFDDKGIDIKEYNPSVSGKFDTFLLTTQRDISAATLKSSYGISGVRVPAKDEETGEIVKDENGRVSYTRQPVDIPAGTPLFFVPKVLAEKAGKAKRYIKDKATNPNSINLGDDNKNWNNTSEIIETASAALIQKYPSPTYPDWVASELISLLNSAQAQGTVVRLEKDLQFGNEDMKVISKDLGETLGALWTMSQADNKQLSLPYQAVNFPENPAFELVDFFGVTEQGLKIPISVKSGATGGKVQITNVIEAAKTLFEISEGVEGALPQEQQFIAVADTNPGGATHAQGNITGRTQPLYLHKILREDPANPESTLGTRTIKKLAEIMSATGMQVSWEDITKFNVEEWLESKTDEELLGNRLPELKDVQNRKTGEMEKRFVEPKLPEGTSSSALLQPLWDIANSTPDLGAYKQARRDKMLLVCSPMGSQAEKMLNKSVAVQNELNRLAQTLTVIQANVNAKKKVMSFQLNKFKDATFVFKWPGYVSGNYMGFLMNINK